MLTQPQWESLNELVVAINDIQDSTAMRTAFLQKLMKLIDFDFAEFDIGIVNNGSAPRLVDPVVVSKYDKKFEEAFICQYENIFAPLDYVNWVFMSQQSLVYRESDLLDAEVRRQSPFYTDYLKVFDLVYIAGAVLAGGGQFHGAVTLYKSEKHGDFSDREVYILKQLLPHLHTRFQRDAGKIKKNEKSLSYLLKNQYHLTNREIEVMGLVYQGQSNAEIGEQAGIAPNTVKKHVYNIYEKLGVNNRTQLIKFVIQNNLSRIWKGE